jgi:hypothetical protein
MTENLAVRPDDTQLSHSDFSKLAGETIRWQMSHLPKSGNPKINVLAQAAGITSHRAHHKLGCILRMQTPDNLRTELLTRGRSEFASEFSNIHSSEPLSHRLLAQSRSHQDLRRLGQLTSNLINIGNNSDERTALRQWIKRDGQTWANERRVALSAVIEAAVRLSLSEAEILIEQVLANPNSPTLSAAVAAQRARMLSITEEPRRARIASHILRWIQIWETDAPTKAALALPSLPPLMGLQILEELSSRIQNAPTLLAWGAATGLIDWLAELPRPLLAEHTTSLFEAIRSRIHNELAPSLPSASKNGSDTSDTPDLAATLVLLLGQVATIGQIEATAAIIAQAFLAPRGLEDATAVQAGRMLVERHKAPAAHSLFAAFGSSSHEFHRFIALLINNKQTSHGNHSNP